MLCCGDCVLLLLVAPLQASNLAPDMPKETLLSSIPSTQNLSLCVCNVIDPRCCVPLFCSQPKRQRVADGRNHRTACYIPPFWITNTPFIFQQLLSPQLPFIDGLGYSQPPYSFCITWFPGQGTRQPIVHVPTLRLLGAVRCRGAMDRYQCVCVCVYCCRHWCHLLIKQEYLVLMAGCKV